MSATSTSNMQSCIDACTVCYQTCLQTALNHCLQSGGKHVEPPHFTLMMNCAQICQTSANFQLSGSRYSSELCRLCAEICAACAQSCEQVGDMEECAKVCRACAESCRNMAQGTH